MLSEQQCPPCVRDERVVPTAAFDTGHHEPGLTHLGERLGNGCRVVGAGVCHRARRAVLMEEQEGENLAARVHSQEGAKAKQQGRVDRGPEQPRRMTRMVVVAQQPMSQESGIRIAQDRHGQPVARHEERFGFDGPPC